MNNLKKFDLINDLPTDNNKPSEIDVVLVNTLFKNKAKKISLDEDTDEEDNSENENFIIKTLKKFMPYIILVFIINLFYFIPIQTVSKFVPDFISNNEYGIVFTKSILAAVLYYVFINFGPKLST